MAIYLDPTGRSTFGIGICDRCKLKFFLDELMPDPNTPGLKVCQDDLDQFDPYRLPARQTERINLPFVRPDQSVALTPAQAVGGGDFTQTHAILAENSSVLAAENSARLVTET